MAENKLLALSFDFAVVIVNLADNVKVAKSSYMTDQLARSGTSVGANIHEAQYAQSTKDFVSKFEIAQKECYETEYWLELLFETDCLQENDFKSLRNECGTIRRMLITSLKTLKENNKTDIREEI